MQVATVATVATILQTHMNIYRKYIGIRKDDLKLLPYEEYSCGYVATVATYG